MKRIRMVVLCSLGSFTLYKFPRENVNSRNGGTFSHTNRTVQFLQLHITFYPMKSVFLIPSKLFRFTNLMKNDEKHIQVFIIGYR